MRQIACVSLPKSESWQPCIDKGQAAFKDFFNSVGDEASFYKPIKKNKTDFFHQQAAVSSTDKKKQLLKSDCNLLSQLFISCQAQECDLPEFFRHENQSFPAALSDTGNLFPGKRSDLVLLALWKIPLLFLILSQNVMSLLMVRLLYTLSHQRPQRHLRNMLPVM